MSVDHEEQGRMMQKKLIIIVIVIFTLWQLLVRRLRNSHACKIKTSKLGCIELPQGPAMQKGRTIKE